LNSALQHHHWAALDEAGGEEYGDAYFAALERLLGLRPPKLYPAEKC
jgi:hypothetical protein